MREPRGGLIMKKAGYFIGSCIAIILLLSGCGKKQSAENSGNLKAIWQLSKWLIGQRPKT